jgi:DNA-binding NarL/FixJ family response regulator
MKNSFITTESSPRPRWLAAFGDLECYLSVRQYLTFAHHTGDICWLDAASMPKDELEDAITTLNDYGVYVVVLSPVPQEEEGFEAISLGAHGYCHVEAAPEQLVDVANVVKAGGFWLPPALVQRFTRLAAMAKPLPQIAAVEDLDGLTQRELEVAKLVGRGASNREIAELMEVSERTVKAHLTSIFDKLGLRDRVQLALKVNHLPIH